MKNNNDLIVQFARLWGQREASMKNGMSNGVSDMITAYDSIDLLDLFTKWKDDYLNQDEIEDSEEFFENKIQNLFVKDIAMTLKDGTTLTADQLLEIAPEVRKRDRIEDGQRSWKWVCESMEIDAEKTLNELLARSHYQTKEEFFEEITEDFENTVFEDSGPIESNIVQGFMKQYNVVNLFKDNKEEINAVKVDVNTDLEEEMELD